VYKTFKEWSKKGYRIEKGAKSSKRNEHGEPLFSSSQVYQPTRSLDGEWDDWENDMCYGGDPWGLNS